MEKLKHKHVDVGGLKLHVAEIGTGPPVVLFLHGFPGIWYSWRHQMIAVANAGFRAIAPDYRGYGLSDQPPEPEKGSYDHIICDLVAMLHSLSISKVFLVGKDFGALVASLFALVHLDKVSGVITIGSPIIVPGFRPTRNDLFPKGLYIVRWKVMKHLIAAETYQKQTATNFWGPDIHGGPLLTESNREPGRAEADFGRFDVKTIVRNVYILFSGSELLVAKENQEIMDLVDPSTPLPQWFTDEALTNYSSLYEQSGFRFPLQVPYRALPEALSISDPKVRVPSLLIVGEKDYCLKLPGLEDYIRSGKVEEYVPNLEIIFLPEGTHFVQEQSPNQVNQLIITFLNNHT